MTSHHQDDCVIYIDESGDLGFSPGGSQYLVIAAICVDASSDLLLKRYVRRYKRRLGLTGQQEIKCNHSSEPDRREFCRGLAQLPCEIRYIVIHKANVQHRLRQDTNILYNYAAQLLLSEFLVPLKRARVFLDLREVKVGSGNSFPDYLRTRLLFELGSEVDLEIRYLNSEHSLGIQAADFVAGAVFRHFERSENSAYNALAKRMVERKRLYF